MNLKFLILISGIVSFVACNTNSQTQTKNLISAKTKVTVGTTVAEQSNKYLITGSSVGSFSRGNLIDPTIDYGSAKIIEVNVGKETKTKTPFYSFVENGLEELRIIPALDPRTNTYTQIIGRINVKSTKYEDEKGIHIGDPVSEFLSTYPDSYIYYDILADQVIMSDQGHGAQYLLTSASISGQNPIKSGRILESLVDPNARIFEISVVRSEQENQDARKNKNMEEKEILNKYYESINGKYYLKEYSENYYKIHSIQGTYYVSECFEGDCKERGEILGATKNVNGFESLLLDGIRGEMVPRWSLKSTESGKELHVHDYDVENDKWSNQIYIKS